MTTERLSLTKELLGTWTLVSHETLLPDGTNSSTYGANPKGKAFFGEEGHFVITVMRSDRANYAIGHPRQGTAEENKATAHGGMTYFGTYVVTEMDRIIAIHIEASSFPNWNGTDQTRPFSISGDQLTLTACWNGATSTVVWKRAK
jgi:hypothetical protein